MHEFSVAKEIVSKIKEVAEEERADEVKEVKLEIGELSHINLKQLEFSYNTLINDDEVLEDSDLVIEKKPVKIDCECGFVGRNDKSNVRSLSSLVNNLKCPECGKRNPSISEGKEIMIRDVEIRRDNVEE